MLEVILFLAAAQGNPMPAPQCSVKSPTVVTRLKDLPEAIQALLSNQLADRGAPFNRGDAVSAEQVPWPFMRLICGYPVDNGYIVEREQGGRGYNVGRLLFRQTRDGFEPEPSETLLP